MADESKNRINMEKGRQVYEQTRARSASNPALGKTTIRAVAKLLENMHIEGRVGKFHLESDLYSEINEAWTAVKVRMTDDQVEMHTVILFCIWVQFIAPVCFKIRDRRMHRHRQAVLRAGCCSTLYAARRSRIYQQRRGPTRNRYPCQRED